MKKIVFIISIILISSCDSEPEEIKINDFQLKTHKKIYQTGIATWYGPGFNGNRTTSGQLFDMFEFTAAHRKLPFGTIIKVTNVKNNRFVIVRINDRGPVNKNLILDLSKIAAANIDIIRKGSGKVEIEILSITENPLGKIFRTYRNIGNL